MTATVTESAVSPERISISKMKTVRRCKKRAEYKYVMDLRRKKKAVQLYRGDWLHQLLMVNADGHDWRQRHAELTATFNELFEEEREELGDLPSECARIFRSYLATYRLVDKGLRVIDSEVDELITLPNGDQFNFIIDLIYEEPDGGIWLKDYKTVKNFMPSDFMLLDVQLTSYFWGAEKMGYKPLRGVEFDELITKPPTIPETLQNGRLTERKNLACDAYTYYATIKAMGLDPQDYRETLLRLKQQHTRWFRRTRLPKDPPTTKRVMRELMMTSAEWKRAKRLGHFPRSPMKDCTWDCDYQSLCQIDLMGGDISDIVKLQFDIKHRDRDD
jgi:hypothetical protein